MTAPVVSDETIAAARRRNSDALDQLNEAFAHTAETAHHLLAQLTEPDE